METGVKQEIKTMLISSELEKKELIIREVSKVNELEVKAPIKIDISGTIGAPVEFLLRRLDQFDQVNQKRCHVLVDREASKLTLITNEDNEYLRGKVSGSLQIHPKFKEFGINIDRKWSPIELGNFIRMQRSFFESKDENMALVTAFKNFTAKVTQDVERAAKDNGDKSDKFTQSVDSNLPASFKLKIPVFKGLPAESIEVETVAQVDGRTVYFCLVSPGANQVIEEIRDQAIDAQISSIREICPDIAIIEQ